MDNFSRERYEAAAHAMQSGVKADLESGDDSASPKHLRVGINAAMSDQGGLVTLLISKGIFTREEYLEAIADAMEQEKEKYEAILSRKLGASIHLV